MSKIDELRSRLIQLNDQYRQGNPTVSDSEYDKLVEELYSLDPKDPFFSKGVIESQPDSRKVKLPIRSMSLDKYKTLESLKQWSGAENCCILPKYDGITIIIDTINDISFITRGDGEVGRDCTEHLQHLKSRFSNLKGEVLKGELIITNETWNKHKETIFKNYTSPRNTVAGWINGDYDKNIPYELMTLVLYQWCTKRVDNVTYIRTIAELNSKIDSDSQLIITDMWLANNLVTLTREDFKECFDEVKEKYPVDGLVVYKNRPNIELFLHEETNGNPIHIKAYKDPIFSEEKDTTIKSITWNMNRFGVMTPVINIDPVSVSNALISKVNGISASYIIDMHLKPGAKITIKRSGEVIPKIIKSHDITIPFSDEFSSNKEYEKEYNKCIETIEKLYPREMEDYIDDMMICPYCGEPLKMDSVNIYCTNEECEEKSFQRLFKFFEIIGVEEYKEDSFRSIWNKGYRTIDSFINLTIQNLIEIDGWGKNSAEDFVSRIQNVVKSSHSIESVAHASGCFPNLAIKNLTILFDYLFKNNILEIGSDGKLSGAKYSIHPEDLCKIDGIGSNKAQLFCSKFNDFTEFVYRYDNWLRLEKKTINKQEKTGKFSGLSFCFTGFRDKNLEQQIQSIGGSIASGVSKKLSYLVVKDKSSTSSKMEAAKKNGTKIIDINELKELL